MPPPPKVIENAINCLGDTTVNSFTASPPTIRPGITSTLKWAVTMPGRCRVKLFLNGSPVSKSGSLTVEPTATTTYRLVGRISTVEQTLRAVTVDVDTSQCVVQSVDEETVRQMLRSLIPPTHRLVSLTTEADEIRGLACPVS